MSSYASNVIDHVIFVHKIPIGVNRALEEFQNLLILFEDVDSCLNNASTFDVLKVVEKAYSSEQIYGPL